VARLKSQYIGRIVSGAMNKSVSRNPGKRWGLIQATALINDRHFPPMHNHAPRQYKAIFDGNAACNADLSPKTTCSIKTNSQPAIVFASDRRFICPAIRSISLKISE
jgi:hypothetical protein